MSSETKPYLISIFMPVYNGSKYLEKSIESVLKQTFTSFELVCVDDTSTDNSYEILKKYEKIDARIRIFQKPNGGNVPKSFNFVIPYLKGDSIAYMSQDDLMSSDNLEKLYIKQRDTDADCVLPDLVFYIENASNNKILSGIDGNRDVILSNRDAVVLSLNWEIHGFALWKSKIFKDEIFPEESFDSDEYMTRKFLLKSNKVVFCSGIFFYRQDNEQSITKTFSIKNYFSILKYFRILQLLEENDFDSNTTGEMLFRIYRTHFDLYRFCSLRKGIYSKDDFKRVRLMLFELHVQLQKRKLNDLISFKRGFNRLKSIFWWVLYFNYSFFKLVMLLFFMIDKVKGRIKVR